ncbi:MAG: Qat anti-phage system QueC-like protein QatC [Pyrinomonadaceae bacterium]
MNIVTHVHASTRHPDGLAKVTVEVPDLETQRDLDISFDKLHMQCGVPDKVSLDLLFVASICYIIDKTVPRASAFDRWTREFEVSIPVSAHKKWQSVTRELESALGFLTGDVWQFSFHEMETDLFVEPKRKRRRRKISPTVENVAAVCLFSGGLDSLIGAIDLLAKNESAGIRLVGHYDAAGAKSSQNELFATLNGYYSRRAELLQVRVSHKPLEAEENTLRSRSLLFMALGIYAARAAGALAPLYAPENGLIAMNIPLTPSRSGSCSTRTMHPFFLQKLREVLRKLEIENPITNPFEFITKGESADECLNPDLLASLIESSVSCSHSTRKQHWHRRAREVRNCGYCVPCLIRRAALHKVELDDPQMYGVDVCQEELKFDDEFGSADDLRAILTMLNSGKTVADFKSEIQSVAPVDRLGERAEMIARGFNEIRALIQNKGSKSVRQAAGIVG